jgi:hypothetical protein
MFYTHTFNLSPACVYFLQARWYDPCLFITVANSLSISTLVLSSLAGVSASANSSVILTLCCAHSSIACLYLLAAVYKCIALSH